MEMSPVNSNFFILDACMHRRRAQVVEYVVLLEYAHLSEFNHQKAFYKILANVCHEYKKREKELEKFIPADVLSLGVESI